MMSSGLTLVSLLGIGFFGVHPRDESFIFGLIIGTIFNLPICIWNWHLLNKIKNSSKRVQTKNKLIVISGLLGLTTLFTQSSMVGWRVVLTFISGFCLTTFLYYLTDVYWEKKNEKIVLLEGNYMTHTKDISIFLVGLLLLNIPFYLLVLKTFEAAVLVDGSGVHLQAFRLKKFNIPYEEIESITSYRLEKRSKEMSLLLIIGGIAFCGFVVYMKTVDTGAIEVEMAAKAGADVVIVLGSADDSTLLDALRSAHKYGVRLMADLISAPDPVKRVVELEALGVDYVNVHIGIDQQMMGKDPIALLREISQRVNVQLAVAGGLDANSAVQAVKAGAKVVIVGGNITHSDNVTEAARKIRQSVDSPDAVEICSVNTVDQEIREILKEVSTSNISDAMHRHILNISIFIIDLFYVYENYSSIVNYSRVVRN